MSSLLEQTKDRLAGAGDRAGEELKKRVPGRRSGASAAVDRGTGRARRAARRAETLGRRAGSGLRAGVAGARELAEERITGAERTQRRRRRKRLGTAAAAGAASGAGAYFLDPDQGKRRRHVARDRVTALFRRAGGRVERAGRHGASTVTGKAQGAASAISPETPAPNDEALADRVRSEIFRPADAPKGSVNVNVENGVVYLRGDSGDEKRVRKLVKDAKSVDGVREVKNLIGSG